MGISPRKLFLITSSLFVLTACPLDFADLDEPRVLNLTVSPSQISQDDTTSTSDFFTIEISVVNFDDPPEEANVFIQAAGSQAIRYSASEEQFIDGNLIVIEDIDYTWFQGYEPGTYNIGVEIESPTVTLVERNQATVTITD